MKSVEKTNEKFIIHSLDGKTIKADKCIIATGGKSYPGTGSTGDGYEIAKSFGHSIKEIKPGLVPIKSEDLLCKNMQGLTLKNVNIVVLENDKKIYSDFGEMMFAHFGLTGPIVLSASSKITRVDNLKEKIKNKEIKILLDLKPALTEEVLDKRICRDFEKYINKEFKNSLNELLPQKIIPEIIEKTGIDKNKKVNQITKEERERLVKTIKAFDINITGLMPVDVGIVTVGGVSLKEVNPKTLESKIVDDLYIIGEVLDLDAYTGGFNLQIAFSTGYACGHFIANEN